MTDAQTVAWAIYIARVQTVVDEQHASFVNGAQLPRLTMCPPTQEHVAMAQMAIDRAANGARVEAIKDALHPMMSALDAIDNSGNKSAVMKECRVGIQQAYDELHTQLAAAEKAVAVDARSAPATK